jgi:sigma-B regulation protein RsbU (phosphoserine phosphatase)
MSDATRKEFSFRSAYRFFGRVGVVFLCALILFLILSLVGSSGVFLTLDSLVLAITGTWLASRALRHTMPHWLWSLRNRLLVVYALIGILPIVLILALVGLGGWALTTELAIYLASSELNRKLEYILGAADSFSKVPPEHRKYAAPNIIDYFKVRFPNIRLYAEDKTGLHAYPEGTPPVDVSPAWDNANGLIVKDGHFFGWAHLKIPDGSITALAPLSDVTFADLVPNLGEILLSEDNFVGHDQDHVKWSANNNHPQKLPNLEAPKDHVRVALRNEGKIPQPVSRFDVVVQFIASYPHYDWNQPNRRHSAYLIVRSRPSAVLSAIFTSSDQLRTLLVALLVAVAVLFMVVEVVALVIGISLSRRMTRAVHELYIGTRRVTQGDFGHRIAVRSRDQLGELATSFNQMTSNVERLLSVEKERERLLAELEIAREVQTQLYPKSVPGTRNLKITVHCEPARVVSGDYYDYETLTSDKLAFAIGDVAGKGISAALLMATLQAALRAQISAGMERLSDGASLNSLGAAHLVAELNRQLYAHTSPEKYATFFFAMYDDATGALTYTNAGHLPPIVIRNGNAEMLDVNGTVVGAFPFSKYDESVVRLQPGDLLVCYTDGITEPENPYGEMFGEDRLIDIVRRNAAQEDSTIVQCVLDAVRNWHAGSELPDDMTLLIARRLEMA